MKKEKIYKKLDELREKYENPDASQLDFAVGVREGIDIIRSYVEDNCIKKAKYLILIRNNDMILNFPNKSDRQYGKLFAYVQFLTEM